jgi:uncharacterized membrane protein YfbV (UPF0208 family)
MYRHLTPRALQRAQWYSDLTAALGEAEKLLGLLDRDGDFQAETDSLRRRIQAVRSELALLDRVTLGEARILGTAWPNMASAGAEMR